MEAEKQFAHIMALYSYYIYENIMSSLEPLIFKFKKKSHPFTISKITETM